jgi:hypothetical protein
MDKPCRLSVRPKLLTKTNQDQRLNYPVPIPTHAYLRAMGERYRYRYRSSMGINKKSFGVVWLVLFEASSPLFEPAAVVPASKGPDSF